MFLCGLVFEGVKSFTCPISCGEGSGLFAGRKRGGGHETLLKRSKGKVFFHLISYFFCIFELSQAYTRRIDQNTGQKSFEQFRNITGFSQAQKLCIAA